MIDPIDNNMKVCKDSSTKDTVAVKILSFQNRRKRRSGDGTPIAIKLRFRPDGTWIRRASGRLVRILDEIPGQFPVLPALIQRLNTDPSLFP